MGADRLPRISRRDFAKTAIVSGLALSGTGAAALEAAASGHAPVYIYDRRFGLAKRGAALASTAGCRTEAYAGDLTRCWRDTVMPLLRSGAGILIAGTSTHDGFRCLSLLTPEYRCQTRAFATFEDRGTTLVRWSIVPGRKLEGTAI
jgi:hypothetical protein